MIQRASQTDVNRVGAPTGQTIAAPSAAAARVQGGSSNSATTSGSRDVSTVQDHGPELGWLNNLESGFGEEMQTLHKTRHHNHIPYPGWPNPPVVHHPKPPVFDHSPK